MDGSFVRSCSPLSALTVCALRWAAARRLHVSRWTMWSVLFAFSAMLGACGGGGSDDSPGGGAVGGVTTPVVTTEPASQSAAPGASVTFSVVTSGNGLAFQWQRSTTGGLSWQDIAGATASAYTLSAVDATMNGHQFHVVIQNVAGIVVSQAATLTVAANTGSVGDVIRDCAEGCPDLVALPIGSYQMGVRPATDVFREQSSPVHTVTIGYSLAVGRAEVSRAEFARFVAATSYVTDAEKGAGCRVSGPTGPAPQADASWRALGFTQTDTEPVVCVSWNDAQAYVAWLNALSPGKSFRLLTEAEWEYVARAGHATSRYPWGDDQTYQLICTYANTGDRMGTVSTNWTNCFDGFGYTAPADAYPANAFGLRNVIGNAWEWVQDSWHADYTGAPTDGGEWPATSGDGSRIYRGGSWANHPTYLDPGYRARAAPSHADESIGFRVARRL